MPARVKRAIKELVELSHIFVRRRDSINENEIGGHCFDCGKLVFARDFQCGHWIPDSTGGALLRYHPQNMHGQASGCNCGYNQEMVKINYTLAMEKKYGLARVQELRQLKNKSIKADIIFYDTLISLYKQGNQQNIIDWLESLC